MKCINTCCKFNFIFLTNHNECYIINLIKKNDIFLILFTDEPLSFSSSTHRYSPVGIVFLIASKLVEMEDLGTMFEQLAYYMVTVLSGLFIHALIVLPVIYVIFTRKNPFTFMAGMIKAILTAWGTASR